VTAGARACVLGAFADGLRAFRAALEITDDERARAAVLSRTANAAVRIYQFESAMADAQEAMTFFDGEGDVVGAAEAAFPLAKCLGQLGRFDEALELAKDRLETVADIAGTELLVARLSRVAAEYLQFRARPREAAPYIDTALQMSDLAEDVETLAASINLLAVQQMLLGSVKVSHLLFAGMAELSRAHELWDPLTIALANDACLLASRDLDSAIDLMRQSVTSQAEHGLPRHLSIESNLCTWYWLAGRWEELDEFLAISVVPAADTALMAKKASASDLLLVWSGARERRLVERFPGEETESVPGLACAECFRQLSMALASGDADGAVPLGRELVALELEMNGVTDDLHAFWPVAVRAAVEAADLDTVGELLAQLAPYSDRALPPALRGQRHYARGLLEMQAEQPDDRAIVTDLEASIAELARAGSVIWEAHAHEELGFWHLSCGRRTEAESHLDAARATYDGLGARRWLARLEAVQAGRTGLPAS
jgi:hypothetical protein